MFGTRYLQSSFASALAVAAVCTATNAQQGEQPAEPAAKPAVVTATEQKRGSQEAPTHAPHLTLPPQVALAFVRAGHTAWLAATSKQQVPPAPAVRPSGAGRYVCAVIVCADLDRDVAPMLGLRREDVLLLSAPGPFLTPEIAASLERQVHDQRLSLVLVLSHDRCATLDRTAPGARRDALTVRVETANQDAARRRLPVEKALAQAQRELLVASSEELATRVDDGTLRVISGQIDTTTGAIAWFTKSIDDLPMPPVK